MSASRSNRIVMKTYCQQQDKSYCNEKLFSAIGQVVSLAEHKLAIKNQEPEKSALCEHYMRFDH